MYQDTLRHDMFKNIQYDKGDSLNPSKILPNNVPTQYLSTTTCLPFLQFYVPASKIFDWFTSHFRRQLNYYNNGRIEHAANLWNETELNGQVSEYYTPHAFGPSWPASASYEHPQPAWQFSFAQQRMGWDEPSRSYSSEDSSSKPSCSLQGFSCREDNKQHYPLTRTNQHLILLQQSANRDENSRNY